jgi:hypothetical protein
LSVDAALAVTNPEKAALTPGCVPTVLTNPTLLRVVVTYNANAVIAQGTAGNVTVDTAGV